MTSGNKLPCPECGKDEGKILESRVTTYRGFSAKRRRRECQECGHRWPTREISEADLIKIASEAKRIEGHLRSLKMINRQIAHSLAECGYEGEASLDYEVEELPSAIEQLAEALVGFLSSQKS